MSPFTFEQQVGLSEEDYVRLFGLVPLHRKRSRLGILITGQSFRCVSEWENLRAWQESSGWLVLSPNGCVPVFLSLEKLKHAGVYERVLDLARQNGAEFGKRRPTSA